jgi:hypothetical protein
VVNVECVFLYICCCHFLSFFPIDHSGLSHLAIVLTTSKKCRIKLIANNKYHEGLLMRSAEIAYELDACINLILRG